MSSRHHFLYCPRSEARRWLSLVLLRDWGERGRSMKILGAVLEEVGRARPFADSSPLRITELDLAPPGPSEVLLRIEAAGICHSDLSVVDGTRSRPTPILLGHEASGVVCEVGSGVDGLSPGDHVVTVFLPRCQTCAACLTDGLLPCIAGSASNTAGELFEGGVRLSRHGEPVRHHLGVSAFASHAVVDHRSVVRVDEDVPPQVAALFGCAVLTGGGAILNASGLSQPSDLMIVGLGGVGMAALLTAVAVGHRVIAVDANEDKLVQATELGAESVVAADEVAHARVTAPVVIECAGSARAFETAFAATAPGGRTVSVGLPAPMARASISPLTITSEARTVVGSYLGSAVPERDIPLFVELWRSGRLQVESLITAEIELEQVNEAMDTLTRGEAVRQMIRFAR